MVMVTLIIKAGYMHDGDSKQNLYLLVLLFRYFFANPTFEPCL